MKASTSCCRSALSVRRETERQALNDILRTFTALNGALSFHMHICRMDTHIYHTHKTIPTGSLVSGQRLRQIRNTGEFGNYRF